MVTLVQLRSFAAVARHRHFTRAAEELLVAQPAISYQVRSLERDLGIQLIDVVGRRVYLTSAGERLAERVAAILNDLANAESEMRDFAAGIAGRVRLGATRTVGGYALPAILTAFHHAQPRVEIALTINNTEAIERMILERYLDLAVVEWQVTSTELDVDTLVRDRLILIASPDHPLCELDSVTKQQLRGQDFITREAGSGTRALAEQVMGEIANDTRVVMELDEPEAIVRFVAAGMGLAFISETIADESMKSGLVCEIKLEGVEAYRDFSLITPRSRQLSPAAEQLGGFLKQNWRNT